MFGNYMDWPGRVDFILFQMSTRNMEEVGEYRVTDFGMVGEDYTESPSFSMVPSMSPTNLFEEVSFCGERVMI